MKKFVILMHSENMPPDKKALKDAALWNYYLKEACRLRAKVFLDASMVEEKDLLEDGVLKDKFDHNSTHFICMEDEKAIGAMRMTELGDGNELKEGYSMHVFKELKCSGHEKAFGDFLKELNKKRKKIAEFSKLAIKKEHSVFRDPKNIISVKLMALSYFYLKENNYHDVFITQGNKNETKKLYIRMGFEKIRRNGNSLLGSFDKYGDENDLMYLDLNKADENIIEFINEFREVYNESEKIVR
ncbi:MAG: N-acyl amino acid synthase FeeM domain-containing protein [Elusimicrobiota bacterium]